MREHCQLVLKIRNVRKDDKLEAMGVMGFVFGMAGLSFAIIARKEIEALKRELKELGITKS